MGHKIRGILFSDLKINTFPAHLLPSTKQIQQTQACSYGLNDEVHCLLCIETFLHLICSLFLVKWARLSVLCLCCMHVGVLVWDSCLGD